MTQKRSVLVFDSGIGGLTIAGEIRALRPDLALTYVADNGAFPYGTKTEAFLLARIPALLMEAARLAPPDILVVACNTASTIILPSLREIFDIPIVGTVPAVKPAAAQSKTGTIGLLGTPGTVRRRYTEDLIKEFAPDKSVIRCGSAALVELAERKFRGEAVAIDEVKAAVADLFDHEESAALDTVVLACTHFPYLKDELTAAFGPGVEWVDSGAAIARRVSHLLGEAGKEVSETPNLSLFLTADPSEAEIAAFSAWGFPTPQVLALT